MNKLLAALTRPLSVKAALQSWLGVPLSLQSGSFWSEFYGTGSFIGKPVTVNNALQLSTGWACVRLISETLATLPCGFYERKADDSRVPARNHPLYEILHHQPNGDMTAAVFWEVLAASLLLWGNAYIEVRRSQISVIALDFLLPERMTVTRLPSGVLEYRYRDSARSVDRVIAEANMMHIPAFSIDGVMGLSPVSYGANVLGTARETDKASAETFQGGLRAPGIVTVDAVMSKQQRDLVRAHVAQVSSEGGVYVLEKGTGFEKLKFDPVDAELLASRSWNVEEICRWFRVDPAMIGHGGKDSNWGTGLEQKMIWFLTFTLRHWCVRIEQAVRKSLLTPVERGKFFAEFAMEGLLRGDSAARASFYSTMTQNGIFTRDDCRVLENRAPMGGNAAVLTVQSNMLPIDKLGQEPAAPEPKPEPVTQKAGNLTVNVAPPSVTLNQKAGDVAVTVPEREVKFEATLPEMKASDVEVNVNFPKPGETETVVTERDAKGLIVKTVKREK